MQFERAVQIDAPAENVWSVLVDVANWPSWNQSVREVELLDGSEVSMGSRFKVSQPRMRPLLWKVTKLEPGRSFSWSASEPGIIIDGDHEIAADRPDGVTVTLRVVQRGPMTWLVDLLTGPRSRRYVQMEADGLKQRCEEAST